MKYQVTVIPSDNSISINGEALQFDFAKPEGIHAIQWHDGTGHVEYVNAEPNRDAMYDKDVAPYVTLWEVEKARLELEKTAPINIETAKAIKMQELSNANALAEDGGYICLENGIYVDGRRSDLDNIIGLLSLAEKGLLSFPLAFRDYYNQNQNVSKEDLQSMKTLMELRGLALYAHKWQLEARIEEAVRSENVDTILSVDVQSAWPGMPAV